MVEYSENALAVYKKLYFRGNEKTFQEVHKRIAQFASLGNHELKLEIENGLNNQDFRFGSPVMMNAGFIENPQTSACFVGKLEDDIVSIFDFDRVCGLIYKEGSGIGINSGRLRETHAPLSKGGFSSGPFAFIRKFAGTCWAVKSGGTSRRAAFMCINFDNHPDLWKFISFKEDHKEEMVILNDGTKEPLFSCMNFSIATSEKFMQAVKNDDTWSLYGVVDKEIKATYKAREIFDRMAEHAWKCGCPGVWFIDRANEDNTLPSLGRYEETNACGEQPLFPYQSCDLASINLSNCVNNNKTINFKKIQKITEILTEALDNMIDISGYPSDEFKQTAIKTRNIGIGPMGVADFLIKLGIPYNSKVAYETMEYVSKFITKCSIVKSSALAASKGTFTLYEKNKEDVLNIAQKFFDFDDPKDCLLFNTIEMNGLRNSHWTTGAPTGTISISCDCSPGIEPTFAVCFDKKISDSNDVWTFINPLFKETITNFLQKKYVDTSEIMNTIINKIKSNHGSVQGIPEIPEELQKLFVTAHDIDWHDRIEMQASIQKGISAAISSTVNLPSTATVEEIKNIYMLAYEKRLKGVTVFRDGSLDNQPVNFGSMGNSNKEEVTEVIYTEKNQPYERPIESDGPTLEYKTPYGRLFITICKDKNNKIFQVFFRIGKAGTLVNLLLDAMSRCISRGLQSGATIETFSKTLRDNQENCFYVKLRRDDEVPYQAQSIVDLIGVVLDMYAQKMNQPIELVNTEFPKTELFSKCPKCGQYSLDRNSGCKSGQCINPTCLFTSCG